MSKTKAELEAELSQFQQQADDIADVLNDDGLSKNEKLNEIGDVVYDDDDE